jgi:Family of unknown function (DUF5662)
VTDDGIEERAYDSRAETLAHARRVAELLIQAIDELIARALSHDASKLEEPELSTFDLYTPKLRDSEYGSPEYREFLHGMGPALAHHYRANRHHPEHFEGGVDEMTLVDLLEMLADWRAATERNQGGNLERSLEVNRERFSLNHQLLRILENTARGYGWME